MNPQTILRAAKLFAVSAVLSSAFYAFEAAGKAQIVTFDPPGASDTYPWTANADGSFTSSASSPTSSFPGTASPVPRPDSNWPAWSRA